MEIKKRNTSSVSGCSLNRLCGGHWGLQKHGKAAHKYFTLIASGAVLIAAAAYLITL